MTIELTPCPVKGCAASRHHYHTEFRHTPRNHSQISSNCEEEPRCYGPAATEPTEPAPLLVLPTVDEIADAMDDPDVGPSINARHILDLLESRVPHWERIEPGTDVKEGTHLLLLKPSGEYACVIAGKGSELNPDPNGGVWYVDPRTVPAEPEDPALAVIVEWMDTPPLGNDAADARDLLARIDAARGASA